MNAIEYYTYTEDHFTVAQCLNVDVSSFGATAEEAVNNLTEAVELYLEGEGDDSGHRQSTTRQAK